MAWHLTHMKRRGALALGFVDDKSIQHFISINGNVVVANLRKFTALDRPGADHHSSSQNISAFLLLPLAFVMREEKMYANRCQGQID